MAAASELAEFNRYIDLIHTTPALADKIAAIDSLYKYVATTTALLKQSKVRRWIIQQINNIYSNTPKHWNDVKYSAGQLCRKLIDEYGESTAETTPGCRSAIESLAFRDLKLLGAGSYGAVFAPALSNYGANGETVEHPGNVAKAFFRKKAYAEIVDKIPKIHEIMGENDGHRMNTYKRKYTVKNLPKHMANILKRRVPKLKSSSDLYLLRMPALGVDIAHIKDVYESVRAIPFYTILKQIQKLIGQTARMAERKYGHFDIRDKNVIIHPTSGQITIIDFDWFMPLADIYKEYDFGYYCQPPESLFQHKLREALTSVTTSSVNSYEFVDSEDFSDYISLNVLNFNTAHTLIYNIQPADVTAYMFTSIVNNANVSNIRYLQTILPDYDSNYSKLFIERVMPTNDNYGLGLTLLEMLGYVYPSASADKVGVKHALRTRITNRYAPYSDAQLTVIVDTLFEVIALLKQMTNMYIIDRIMPAMAKTKIDSIVHTFDETYPTGVLVARRTRRSGGRT